MDEKTKMKYAVAFIYGDGYVAYHGKEARFEANTIIDNQDYIDYRIERLSEICPLFTYELNIDFEKYPNRRRVIKTTSRTHPTYSKIRDRMYINNRKVIDPHYLTLLDWETLAIWFMDDGSNVATPRSYKDKSYICTPRVTLGTCIFSYGDQLLLKEAFKEKFNLEFNINKHFVSKNFGQSYILSLQAKSYNNFIDGVSKYILPSFEYKLHPNDKLVLKDDEDIVRTT